MHKNIEMDLHATFYLTGGRGILVEGKNVRLKICGSLVPIHLSALTISLHDTCATWVSSAIYHLDAQKGPKEAV